MSNNNPYIWGWGGHVEFWGWEDAGTLTGIRPSWRTHYFYRDDRSIEARRQSYYVKNLYFSLPRKLPVRDFEGEYRGRMERFKRTKI